MLSFQAAYATPIILMSQNRQTRLSERRNHLDLQINLLAEQENTEQLRLIRLLCVKHGIALESPAVIEAFAANEVAALRADWTRQDPSITRMLEANGRAGVPLYLFYPKPGPQGERRGPIILPQILTAATILREMQNQ